MTEGPCFALWGGEWYPATVVHVAPHPMVCGPGMGCAVRFHDGAAVGVWQRMDSEVRTPEAHTAALLLE